MMIRLTDQFALELNKFKLVCFYDGAPLDETTVNQPCLANNTTDLQHGN